MKRKVKQKKIYEDKQMVEILFKLNVILRKALQIVNTREKFKLLNEKSKISSNWPKYNCFGTEIIDCNLCNTCTINVAINGKIKNGLKCKINANTRDNQVTFICSIWLISSSSFGGNVVALSLCLDILP